MRKSIRILLLCLCLTGALLALAQQPAPAPAVRLPDNTKISRLVVESFWQVNCFIIAAPNGKAVIIDPGDDLDWLGNGRYHPNGKDAKRIHEFLLKNKLKLQCIVLTHGHLDHIGACKYLKDKTGAKVLMHANDVRPAGDPLAGCPKDNNLFDAGFTKVDRTLADNEILTVGDMSFKVLFTPGHGVGSICLYTTQKGKPLLFSGDTLLHYYKGYDGAYYDTGRTNFRDGTGNQELLYRMVREKLFTLPDETLVYPGHYDFTTIGEEKKYSPANKPPFVPDGDNGAAQNPPPAPAADGTENQ